MLPIFQIISFFVSLRYLKSAKELTGITNQVISFLLWKAIETNQISALISEKVRNNMLVQIFI